ncbi:hypothetical protein AVEN_58704-1 [Araneus ventricosus]|uniref:Uncharacterized protein n=1 Tax=Araneus ventricosus TaxID=182803 RepID=A0A4Y2JCQ8_ARAVE|nr:hypothetical protein AVEN_58704-1 [Araneus ventricosus]
MTSYHLYTIKAQADPQNSLRSFCKMIKAIICAVFFLSVHFACAQVLEDPILGPSIARSSNRPRPSDPVSAFLSGLGNLILDIDETFARQTAPKGNAEDEMKQQMYGRPRSGTGYFNRIRENYRDIQRRLGKSLGILDLRMSSDLGSVNVQNKGPESLIDASLPSLPIQVAVSSNRGLKTSDNVNDISELTNIEPEQISPRFTSSFKLGNTEINVDSKMDLLQPSELLKNVENQIKKALEDIRMTNDKNGGSQTEENAQEKKRDKRPELENESNLATKEFSSRSGNEFESSESSEVDDSSPEGRILGDVLYSESTFDKLTKRVMKDAKWAIDLKVFPSRVVEKLKQFSDKATENIAPKKTEEATISRIPQQPKRDAVKQDFKKRKSLKPLSNDLETVLNDEKINIIPQQDINPKFEMQDSKRQKDSIILAFTPEGVALKLRMGPEVINPLKFLHKVLSAYGVSLNIPVVSYDDIEPVGREILQLGTGSGGTMTRALFIDLSDSFQLESLLRTLRSTQMLQEKQSEGTDQEGF